MDFEIYRKPLQDVLMRSLKTFLQTFTAVLIASGTGYLEIDVVKTAAIAGGAAVLSVIHNSVGKSDPLV